MSTLINDIKYSIRQLQKSPGFTFCAVLILALGIGANTAIFSRLNAVFLKSLPVKKPHELRVLKWIGGDLKFLFITGECSQTPDGRDTAGTFTYPMYCDLRDHVAGTADVFAFSHFVDLSMRTQDKVTFGSGRMVSGNFFGDLGVKSLLGRTIEPDDDQQGAEPVVVISHWAWQQYFGLDPEVIGQTVTLNDNALTIVGVLPKGFFGPKAGERSDFYTPLSTQPQLYPDWPLDSLKHWWVQIMVRMRPGTNDSQIQAALSVALNQTVSANALSNSAKPFRVLLEDGSSGPRTYRDKRLVKPLFMQMGIVGMVLLVACANLASLLLARGVSRQHELSVRVALGAGRWQLIRQSLTESMLISIMGAGVGLLIAIGGKKSLFSLLLPAHTNFDLQCDMTVLGFTTVISLAAGLLFGLIPALRCSCADPIINLKGRSALSTPRQLMGKILVSTQVGLSLLLLVGAGLFIRTVINLRYADPGFNTKNLLMVRLDSSQAGYKGQRIVDLYEQVRTTIAGLPGVKGVVNSDVPLLSNFVRSRDNINIPASPSNETISVMELQVSDSFLSTMGIPLVAGRDFTLADNETSSKVIIINRMLAEKVFPESDPVDGVLKIDRTDYRIVGVCEDIKYDNIKNDIKPTIFYPYRQRPNQVSSVWFEVRTEIPPLTIVPAIEKALTDIDRNLGTPWFTTQKRTIYSTIEQERLFALLSTATALLAVFLSCIGLFGLMAYNITRRTSEIGIRIALGATPYNIALPILREALILAAIGVAIGSPIILALARVTQSIIYGIKPHDPLTLTVAIILLLVVAVLAAWIPARRAAKVDPMEALRYE